jgi:hypothetical protein
VRGWGWLVAAPPPGRGWKWLMHRLVVSSRGGGDPTAPSYARFVVLGGAPADVLQPAGYACALTIIDWSTRTAMEELETAHWTQLEEGGPLEGRCMPAVIRDSLGGLLLIGGLQHQPRTSSEKDTKLLAQNAPEVGPTPACSSCVLSLECTGQLLVSFGPT